MVKHILYMAIFHSIVIFTIVFAGEHFIPEESGYEPNLNGMVYPGRQFTFSGEPLWLKYAADVGVSRHYTVVFTVFVFMQITNMIAARKINDEKNIFEGFFSNSMFYSIWFMIVAVQVVLSQFSQDIFKCARAVSSITSGSVAVPVGVRGHLCVVCVGGQLPDQAAA